MENIFTDQPDILTAVTNLFICAESIVFAICSHKKKEADRFKRNIYFSVFVLVALSAIMGFIVHGFLYFENNRSAWNALWIPLSAAMIFAISLVIPIVSIEALNIRNARLSLYVSVSLCILFSSIGAYMSINGKDPLYPMYVFGVIALIYVVSMSLYLIIKKSNRRALLILIGIAIAGVGMGVQMLLPESLKINIIWEFNRSGISHLIIFSALPFIYRSLE